MQTQSEFTTTVTPFDTYRGQEVYRYTIENAHGVRLSVLNLGGILNELSIPSANGRRNLVLNYPHSADYYANPFYVNMAIGRTAGRIGHSRLTLNNRTYLLPQNEGDTTLHGGPHGFHQRFWVGKLTTIDDCPAIQLTTTQHPEDDGFPGTLTTTMTYQLSLDNTVTVTFAGTCDTESVFNPTLHTYFNLGDAATILAHTLQVNATNRLATQPNKVPTGTFTRLANTPFDFQQSRPLQQAIDGLQRTSERGLDDVYCVTPDEAGTVAHLADPDTGVTVTVGSHQNGLVVFTANSFTTAHMPFIKTGGHGNPYLGIALEPHTLPDATAHPNFGDITIHPGQPRLKTLSYHVTF
ncbi:aldose epimerase family protein [Furfurilactobacillus sp. WILCCON 0119]